jgi:polysaccharide pyruvyl transferase WcaK-like protein
MTRWLYAKTTDLATHVSYRDQESADAMRESGSKAEATVGPDVAFTHPAPTTAEPEPGLVVVGAMAYYGHADDPVRGAGVRREYVATLAGALGRILDTGCRVELVGGDGVDIEIAEDVRAAVLAARPDTPPDRVVVRACTRFAELTEVMSRAEVVVASRFHNLICALRLARPPVSVGYAGKNHHLMRAMGLEDYIQVIDDVDADRLVDQVQSARQEQSELSDQIRRATADYPDRVRALLDQVAVGALRLEPSGHHARELNEVGAWPRT